LDERHVLIITAVSSVRIARIAAVPQRSWFGFSLPPDPKETQQPEFLYVSCIRFASFAVVR
jgi:hypothetical protein